MHRYAFFAFLLTLAALAGLPQRARAQEELPYTVDQLVRLLQSGAFTDGRILELTRESCLGFSVNDEAVDRLIDAGASRELIDGLRRACVRMMTVEVAPAEVEVALGSSRILHAQALVDSTQIAGVVFEWNSADTTIVEVSSGGVVLGKAIGVTQVTARMEGGLEGHALVRVLEVEEGEAEPDSLAAETTAGKSVGTAAALGIIPGGGEFYVGNTAKGAVVLLGAAAAVTAGFLISSEDTLSVTPELVSFECPVPSQPTSCSYRVNVTVEKEETSYVVVGAAVAGAFWLYGLIDGIIAAKKSRAAPAQAEQLDANPGLSLELIPRDGLRVGADGSVEFTVARVRQ